jgi:hypothetical protein
MKVLLPCYNYKEIYNLADEGKNVDQYIDYDALNDMQRTIDKFSEGYELRGDPLK